MPAGVSVTPIAAAGNSGASIPGYPALFSSSIDSVLSVGAIDQTERLAWFSNRVGSSGSQQVDAPGVSVYSTYAGGGFRILSGTSMAAPHAAGVAALTISANPDLTPSEVRALLLEGAKKQASGSDSRGIVDARTTLAYARAGQLLKRVFLNLRLR